MITPFPILSSPPLLCSTHAEKPIIQSVATSMSQNVTSLSRLVSLLIQHGIHPNYTIC